MDTEDRGDSGGEPESHAAIGNSESQQSNSLRCVLMLAFYVTLCGRSLVPVVNMSFRRSRNLNRAFKAPFWVSPLSVKPSLYP